MNLRRGLVLVCLLAVIGCGQKTLPQPTCYPVKGRVLLKGQPAKLVFVRFLPVNGGPQATGRTDGNGSFTLRTFSNADPDGAPAGEYNVVIEPFDAVKMGGERKG